MPRKLKKSNQQSEVNVELDAQTFQALSQKHPEGSFSTQLPMIPELGKVKITLVKEKDTLS